MSSSPSQIVAQSSGKASAAAFAWRFRGELRVTAIVKATFAFAADAAMTRIDPQAIFADEVHHAKNPTRSVAFTSDFVPYRKRADVLFTGHAYAPGGSAESMHARLAIFPSAEGQGPLVDKTLLVRRAGGFRRINLTYEHAFGGFGHEENPYGEGFPDGDASDELNVFDPADPRRPIGFAPIPSRAPIRAKLLGAAPRPSFGEGVAQVPDTVDWEFFQSAPANQRIDFLRGDEWLVLEGLTPQAPRLRTRLPGARAVARIHGLSGFGVAEGAPLAMYADTLHISGDEQRCTVTWRGSFAVASEAALGSARIAVGVESPGEPIAWPDSDGLARTVVASARPAPAPRKNANETMTLSDDDIELIPAARPLEDEEPSSQRTVVLPEGAPLPQIPQPFAAAPAMPVAPAPLMPATPAPVMPATPAPRARGNANETLMIPSRRAPEPKKPTLPFQPAAGAVPVFESKSPVPRRPAGSAGATLPIPSRGAPQRPAIPFQPQSPPPAPEPPASESPAPEPPASEPPAPVAAPIEPPEAPKAEIAAEPKAAVEPQAPAEPKASPWAPQPEPAPEPPRPPAPKKSPPKVDVKNVLYGSKKKGS